MLDPCLFCDIGEFHSDSAIFMENELAVFGNIEDGRGERYGFLLHGGSSS